jgi:hypothetical protein
MAVLRSGAFAWSYVTTDSTGEVPDAYRLQVGRVSGTYTYCSCYEETTVVTNLRGVLSTSGTYFAKLQCILGDGRTACSSEITFTAYGTAVYVGPFRGGPSPPDGLH